MYALHFHTFSSIELKEFAKCTSNNFSGDIGNIFLNKNGHLSGNLSDNTALTLTRSCEEDRGHGGLRYANGSGGGDVADNDDNSGRGGAASTK